MSKGKLAKWIKDKKVLLVCIPLITGIHVAWYKLQQNPKLVAPAEKREFPIITLLKEVKQKFLDNRPE